MARTFLRGSFLGMPVKVKVSVLPSTIIFALAFGVLLVLRLPYSPLEAVIIALLGTLAHLLGEVLHQYGHFMMAKLSGYPSKGLALWGLLGTTLYPEDEGDVPSRVHIQRASGGPIMSLLIAAIVLLLFRMLNPQHDVTRFLLIWIIFENAIIFCIGSLFPPMPMGDFVNDGAVIMRELKKMRSHTKETT